jgi:glycosyltransferase involved in cell wall biosynthesis
MVVAYYTSTNFLDVVLETIQGFKTQVELHIFIEITPASKNTTIINVASLDEFNNIETPERLLGKEKWDELKGYFEGVASVHFLVHKDVRSLTFKSLRKAFAFGKYLRQFKVDVFHFDTVSPRAIGLYFYLRSKKVFITLHDPVPHSGETNWREHLPNFVFYGMARGYFFYSQFANEQFRQYYKRIKVPFYNLRLQPYSFISQFMHKHKRNGNAILFFGRLSYYKGIDLLLEAIPKVLEKYPQQKFIIAGKPAYGYKIDGTILEQYKNNLEVLLRYISIEELVTYFESSKFVVCPYRDATQSGVLMTCRAAGKMVVATRVGSFPEYIQDNVDGLLAEPNPQSIAEKIIEALEQDRYKTMEQHIVSSYSDETGTQNGNTILKAYQS